MNKWGEEKEKEREEKKEEKKSAYENALLICVIASQWLAFILLIGCNFKFMGSLEFG